MRGHASLPEIGGVCTLRYDDLIPVALRPRKMGGDGRTAIATTGAIVAADPHRFYKGIVKIVLRPGIGSTRGRQAERLLFPPQRRGLATTYTAGYGAWSVALAACMNQLGGALSKQLLCHTHAKCLGLT